MLVWPAHLNSPMVVLRNAAIMWGILPQRTCERSSSNVTSRTYRGTGLWWDPTTQKIHARFSATHFKQPGVTDYSGSTDPSTLSLSVSLYGHYAVNSPPYTFFLLNDDIELNRY
jgi:hypothetical protein